VRFDGATLRTDDDGLLEAVIDDAVTIERVGVSSETDTDTDTDDDADGDTDTDSDETDAETSETTESPDSPETPHPHPHSSSEDTATGEATADGGKIEAGDDADDTTETDASPSLSAEPDSIRNPNENAPETQADRLRVFQRHAR
jgi:hypothetical protein